VEARPRPQLVALVLALLALGVYARTLGFPYVELDDPGYVRDNPHLADGLTWASARWALTSTAYQYNWHPLTWLSHALDVEIFGPTPGPRHLENAVLHSLTTALLFLALVALGARPWPSAWAAALFAVHPVRVESVAWIAQRKDVLAGLFFATTLLLYARYVRAPSAGRMALLAASLAAGLASKPTLVTLPGLLLLLDLWPLGRLGREPLRRLIGEKLPLFALAAAGVGLTLLAQESGGAVKEVALTTRLVNAGESVGAYLWTFLVPRDLAVFYPHPALARPGSGSPAAALGIVALAGLGLFLAWRLRARAAFLFVGTAWFLGVLVPMLGLVQVGFQARADRYAYLAQFGLELVVAFGAAEFVRFRPAWRAPLAALALAWLTGLAWLTTRQLGHWRDSEALFRHALAVTHENFVAHNNLGLVLARARRFEEAAQHFEAARNARPGFFEAELNLGLAREALAEPEAALAALACAAALRPESSSAHLAMARVYLAEARPREADAALARALELEPALADDPRARALGLELARQLEAR
jgi:tetratricopeptide (TPR) repeat protein